jgi:hypothetical protein
MTRKYSGERGTPYLKNNFFARDSLSGSSVFWEYESKSQGYGAVVVEHPANSWRLAT